MNLHKQTSKIIINSIIVSAVVLLNTVFQIYCRPVWWAGVVAVICLLWTIAKPLVQEKVHPVIRGVLSALSCLFWSYCFFFILTDGKVNISILYGMVFWAVFCVLEWLKMEKTSGKKVLLTFLIVNLVMLSGLFVAGKTYRKTAQDICEKGMDKLSQSAYPYWTERIAGMHFIYHTRYCIYDGWRPPKLDPLLTVALALNNYNDPLRDLPLKERLQLYRKLYPHRPYKFKCSCGLAYSKDYHRAELWQDLENTIVK